MTAPTARLPRLPSAVPDRCPLLYDHGGPHNSVVQASPLHIAAAYRQAATVAWLLDNGADIDAPAINMCNLKCCDRCTDTTPSMPSASTHNLGIEGKRAGIDHPKFTACRLSVWSPAAIMSIDLTFRRFLRSFLRVKLSENWLEITRYPQVPTEKVCTSEQPPLSQSDFCLLHGHNRSPQGSGSTGYL